MKNLQFSKKTTEKGYTLAELAIVFAIFGIMAGALWVAARSVVSGASLKTASDTSLIILDNMHALYSSQSKINIAGSANTDITEEMRKAGVLPAATFRDNPNVTNALPYNNWSGRIWIAIGSDNHHFRLYMDNVPSDDCIKLVDGALNANGLSTAYVQSNTWKSPTASSNPLTPSSFSCNASCPMTGSVTSSGRSCVGLEFSLWYSPS